MRINIIGNIANKIKFSSQRLKNKKFQYKQAFAKAAKLKLNKKRKINRAQLIILSFALITSSVLATFLISSSSATEFSIRLLASMLLIGSATAIICAYAAYRKNIQEKNIKLRNYTNKVLISEEYMYLKLKQGEIEALKRSFLYKSP